MLSCSEKFFKLHHLKQFFSFRSKSDEMVPERWESGASAVAEETTSLLRIQFRPVCVNTVILVHRTERGKGRSGGRPWIQSVLLSTDIGGLPFTRGNVGHPWPRRLCGESRLYRENLRSEWKECPL